MIMNLKILGGGSQRVMPNNIVTENTPKKYEEVCTTKLRHI